MGTYPDGFTQRHLRPGDAREVLVLIEACETAEYGSSDTDADSLQEDWSRIDLEKDAILLYDASRRLVGYAAVAGSGKAYQIDFSYDPRSEWINLGDYLLEQSLNRVQARLTTAKIGTATIRSYAAHANNDKLQVLEKRGFSPERYHLQMQIAFERAPERAHFPAQFSLRGFDLNADAGSVYALMRAAFERPGKPFPEFEDWKSFMIDTPQFDPGLWRLLEQNGALVGASLCYEYPSYGWVRQLGVLPQWRRQGLGKSLLLHSFEKFYERGCRRAALGVAAENANAQALYERAGMHVARQYDEYVLRMIV